MEFFLNQVVSGQDGIRDRGDKHEGTRHTGKEIELASPLVDMDAVFIMVVIRGFMQIGAQGGVVAYDFHGLGQKILGQHRGLCQGMTFRHDDHQLKFIQGFIGKLPQLKKGEQRLFIPVRIPDDGHGRAAVGYMADGVQRSRFIIIYRQLPASGVFAEKRGERAGDVAGAGDADMQADIVPFLPGAVIFQGLILLYGPFCQGQEFPPLFRGNDAPGAAGKDRKPDFLLQFPYVAA